METRIEIFRDSLWRTLRFRNNQVIKYNAVINRIAGLDVREISHSNTFSIPPIFENRDALGLNFWNKLELAKALNSKFPARYYVDDKLLQVGFVVINNTRDGNINLNFIDEALDITDIWGSITFINFLRSTTVSHPSDYQTAIDEMKGYVADKTAVLTPLSTVGTRGYNLAYFPNSLNSVGDNFQLDDTGNRIDNSFNPYQSRPIFNMKAFLDLICESYGYTTDFTASVDLDTIESTCMVASGLGESEEPANALITVEYTVVSTALPHVSSPTTLQTVFLYPAGSNVFKPNDIAGWSNPPGYTSGYESLNCVFKPNIEASTSGIIYLTANKNPSHVTYTYQIFSCWADTITVPGVLFQSLAISVDNSTSTLLDIDLDKANLATPPAGAGAFLGIIVQRTDTIAGGEGTFVQYSNLRTIEELIPSDKIVYDEFSQYEGTNVDLTHAAPTETLKTLLSSYLQKEGMLINIDAVNKEVKFFTYGHYETQRDAGNYSDWSSYLQKYEEFEFNTDYGGSYYKNNKIGLTEPYTGNSVFIELTNQGADSKLKDSGSNLVKNFKDVSGIVGINHSTADDYFEYKNLGLGLVELGGSITGLTQNRADGTTQGAITSLQQVQNVNYVNPPKGVGEWYRLVDTAVKVEAKFLLPVSVIKNLDLSEPIYVEELGGFYIIEEIAEYINPQTIVNVKLIKLIDNIIA